MTEKSKDLTGALDALEEAVERRQSSPDSLLSELATLLLGFPRDSEQRPRAHRMLGVVYSQMGRDADALKELGEARTLAAKLSPPSYRELGNVARAMSAIHAASGDDRLARDELVTALAFTAIGGKPEEVVRLVADVAQSELEARRFENSALLFDFLLTGNDTLMVPDYAVHSARINLVQALNALGRHEEVPAHVKVSNATLSEDDRRLRFLTQLEAARASAGLGRHDEAEGGLLVAENFLPEDPTAIDHSEFVEAVTELQEIRAGEPAVESLKLLVEQYTEQDAAARVVVACRALANALLRRGDVTGTLSALGCALRAALEAKLKVAGELRTEILRRAGADRLLDLAGSKSLVGLDGERDLRFVKLRPLGHGSAGDSVLALDMGDGEEVSLRTLDLGALGEKQREAVLSKERRAYATVATLHDARIAKIRDMRLAPGGSLYTLQLRPEGPTLRDLYTAGTEPARMLSLLADTAGALGVLHRREIVHRDLTPDHVVIGRDNQGRELPVLIELGLAPVAAAPGVGGYPGVPPYVAPEQVAGAEVDTSADIYALGQMIAELWGGRVPSRANLGRLWKRDAGDQMPRDIGDLVRGMTAPEPSRRTTDLGDIIEALKAQLNQEEPAETED
ncbi:protein kinase [Methyloceanibacter sp. wino2]|uniref:protein kinase domain-containing protein n=1 Tax=Methyloceanibacter sp. wino2 TaxID=2170729 RepID=UPI000D3E1AD8|nr:protein kinase [Methyloceanibacter sp. wino2]